MPKVIADKKETELFEEMYDEEDEDEFEEDEFDSDDSWKDETRIINKEQ